MVFEDADIDAAIPHIMAAAFWNMSESCSCGSRLIVHEKVKQSLLTQLVTALKDWKVGDPRLADVAIGPMVEQAHFEKVRSFLDLTIKEGGG